jgi:AcrR family transcriptional regulator
LLAAAGTVLRERGMEGATVPAIAREAGVSVGLLYKHFADKDALLRELLQRVYHKAIESNRNNLDPAKWAAVPLDRTLAMLVGAMVRTHREHRHTMRALMAFAENHSDRRMRKLAAALRAEAVSQIGAILLHHRKRIRRPNPDRAVQIVAAVLGLTLNGLLTPERERRLGVYLTDADLPDELLHLVSAYLGVGPD